MRRLFISFLAFVAFVFVSLCLLIYLPWWLSSLLGFFYAIFMRLRPLIAFLLGFLGLAITWGGFAYYLDNQNNHLLADKIALLFHLSNHISLVLMTAFIGGILGGLGALTASFLNKPISPKSKYGRYYFGK